ncbi:MAG TPA: ester cyclase [Steroidobacteraceae bacterium]|jgi:predicted SnoaL-like aldol condensation-catalyzing enzyme|nr:ester cyclase [Steroidobacteraceae bacterium]
MSGLRKGGAVLLVGLAAACSAVSAQAAAPPPPAWSNPFPKAEVPGAATDTPEERANRGVVLEFYDRAFNAKDFTAASRFIGPRYIEHSVAAAEGDGAERLRACIQHLKAEHPDSRTEVKQILTDGNYVILRSHRVFAPGTLGDIVGDIYRLENGKLVEHWRVVQPVPAKANPKNHNGAF